MMSLMKFIVILLSVLKVALLIEIFDAQDDFVLENTSMTNNILQMSEKLRTRMHLDMTDLGISRLDPLSINEVILQTEFFKGAPSTMTNIKVVGLKSFKINEVNFNKFGMEFQLDVTVPTLKINGNYEADGIIVKVIPFKGKGPFNFELFNVTLKCDGRLRYSNNNWSVPDLNIYFAFDGIKGGFDQLSNTLINEIVNDMGPKIVKDVWPVPVIQSYVVDESEKIILRQLGHISLENFINVLSSGEIKWPPVPVEV